jgi:hypothetical protein
MEEDHESLLETRLLGLNPWKRDKDITTSEDTRNRHE